MEIVAATVGVADVAGRVSHRVWRLCEAWKDAPRDVFQLRDDLSRAQEFYGSLREDVARSVAALLTTPPSSPTEKAASAKTADVFYDPEFPSPEVDGAIEDKARRTASNTDSGIRRQQAVGPVQALLELIKNGLAAMADLETIVEVVAAAGGNRLENTSSPEKPAKPVLSSRRRMVWLTKANQVKRLRGDVVRNMMMVSGALLALNA
jgi:hypothetical protein